MPRSTDYDKLVSKHRAELFIALESVRLQLKAAHMWELTAENCHQIYSRLGRLRIDLFPSSGTTSPVASLSVIELHPRHNNPDPDPDNNQPRGSQDDVSDGIAFFGSIPQLVANINSTLLQLEAAGAVTGDSAPNRQNQEKAKENENELFEEEQAGDSFFIDISATLPAPRIMQHEEAAVVARKFLLLHIASYLRVNLGARCLNANDCLRSWEEGTNKTAADALERHSDATQPWDLCFLSGVFLGYPVLYCNSTPEQGNCLGHQALLNYTVLLDDYTLYSFSVPQLFSGRYRRRINRWFEALRQKTDQSHRLSMHQVVETHALILT